MMVARAIIAADGEVDSDEVAFVERNFPQADLMQLDLLDPAEVDRVAEDAMDKLADAMAYHEKLALLELFYGSCKADGTVVAPELRVLHQATMALGMDRKDVGIQLQRLWKQGTEG